VDEHGLKERLSVGAEVGIRVAAAPLLHIAPAPLKVTELLEQHPNLVLDWPSGEVVKQGWISCQVPR
jgi:hypothetical protein